MPTKPKGTTLRKKVLQFFRTNQDEELYIDDAIVKWPHKPKHVSEILLDMEKLGQLKGRFEYTRKNGGTIHRKIYSAGPRVNA